MRYREFPPIMFSHHRQQENFISSTLTTRKIYNGVATRLRPEYRNICAVDRGENLMGHAHAAISLEKDTPELADTYEEASVVQFDHGKILIDALRIGPGERVLDIGSGTGRLAQYVAGIVAPTGEVFGIDPLGYRVAIAQSRASTGLSFSVGRAEDLSKFADGQFDVVYLNSVFHWIEDKPRVLREIFRVLKAGGRIGLNTQDPSKPHQSRLLVRAALVRAGVRTDGAVHPSLGVDGETLEALVTAADFNGYRGELRTLVDFHADAETLIRWSASSSFGNFLIGLSDTEQGQVRATLAELLEEKRTPKGIRVERYLHFATAQKPLA
jgi:SAM-dependent methyltransferase